MTFTWGPVGTPLPHMKPADSRFHNPKSSDSNWDRTSDWTIVGPSLAVLDEKLSDESVIARFDRLNQDFLPESPWGCCRQFRPSDLPLVRSQTVFEFFKSLRTYFGVRGVQETLFEQIVVLRPRKNPSGFTG